MPDLCRYPILLAKCCKSIIGCEECVNRWYSGPDALTKSCPRCRSERGYNETMRVLGLDDLLTGLKRLNDTACMTCDFVGPLILHAMYARTEHLLVINRCIHHQLIKDKRN